MITADIQLNDFNRGINRLITRVGLDAKRVLKKEVAELTKTLVKLTPPKNLASSKAKAAKSTAAIIRPIPPNSFRGKQRGSNEHRWLYASPQVLVGVNQEDYRPELAVKPARKILFAEKQRKASFRLGRRGNQVVTITQRKMVKPAVFRGVIREIQNNFGRQKAGWLAGVFKGEVKLTGAGKPPAWVTKHRHGLRGGSIDQTATTGKPSYTIINFAKGISSKHTQGQVIAALKIRAKAMKKNLEMILAGKKEYAY